MVLKRIGIAVFILSLSFLFMFYAGEGRELPVPTDMVLVRGGTFLMGSKDIFSDEEPVHSVTLSGFYMGKYEVTQAEWQAVMGDSPSLYKGNQLPVESVDWNAAVEYCNKKSQMEGLKPCYQTTGDTVTCDFNADGYRLPTEAEWEYASRGGKESGSFIYSGSNEPQEVAWYEVNSKYKTQPVGQKKPNELGLFDLSGNVWEWCWDLYDKDYYKTGPVENPRGPTGGDARCYRGGGSNSPEIGLRSHSRFNRPPHQKNFDLGFRVVKNLSARGIPPGMVLVPGGTFKMGSSNGKFGEKAVHPVTLYSFYIGKYEITQEEFKAIMGYNPSYRKGSVCPIHIANWYEAVEYCNKRSEKEGLTPCYSGSGDQITCNFAADGYRLPTEAEWEYAARGGQESRNYIYSGSNDSEEVAWHRNNLIIFFEPVGLKKPNELGIYDMSGNVIEWCWDWYDFDYYKNSAAVNPPGPMTGLRRTARGGSIYHFGDSLQSRFRGYYEPYRKGIHIGFRVVRSAK